MVTQNIVIEIITLRTNSHDSGVTPHNANTDRIDKLRMTIAIIKPIKNLIFVMYLKFT